ncbi:hypothetical protein OsI_29218 [Oryza sativa Indica Group]|uniref:Uncharacterized protein n=1 Tax=Oryza sativa subsp. indica TaxID=39946 RepID=B8BAR5_ORYSI|nr:hypothetical protein OsI_29218 [Oryza sativa Indica Group]
MFVLVQALVYHILRSSSSVFSKDSKLGGATTRRRRHGRRGGRRQGEVASTGERGGGGRRGGDGGRRARLRMGSSGADDFAPLSLIVVGGSRRGRRTPLIGDGDRDHRAAGFSSLVRWAAAPHSRRPHASAGRTEVASIDDDEACELVSGADLVIGGDVDNEGEGVRAYLLRLPRRLQPRAAIADRTRGMRTVTNASDL